MNDDENRLLEDSAKRVNEFLSEMTTVAHKMGISGVTGIILINGKMSPFKIEEKRFFTTFTDQVLNDNNYRYLCEICLYVQEFGVVHITPIKSRKVE